MEKRFKLRFSNIFQSSFFSCRSKKNSDIILTNKSNHPTISSKPPQIPSKLPKTPHNPSLFPKSPPLSHLKDCLSRRHTRKIKNKTPNPTKTRRKKTPTWTPAEEFGGAWWYDGGDDDDDENETETLFSSRSMTSDSSGSRRRRQRRHGRRRSERKVKVKVKDGFFAVVTSSSDPYRDFKASMAEMVVEKRLFGGKELEDLLHCFISLNSPHYHKVIFEVYYEIKEALSFL